MLKQSLNQMHFLDRALDGSWLKNEAISNNLANAETPGYKREVVRFEEALKSELNRAAGVQMRVTDPRHMTPEAGMGPRIEKVRDTSVRKDENNVDIDVEMAELAANQIQYNATINQLNHQISRLKSVIRNGR
jgi:flagellar basal-body rod protein FlgB